MIKCCWPNLIGTGISRVGNVVLSPEYPAGQQAHDNEKVNGGQESLKPSIQASLFNICSSPTNKPINGHQEPENAKNPMYFERPSCVVVSSDKPRSAKGGGVTPYCGERNHNRIAAQWCAFSYSDSEDELRIKVVSEKSQEHAEELDFDIGVKEISIRWGSLVVPFSVSSASKANR